MKCQVIVLSFVSVAHALVCCLPAEEDLGRIIFSSVIFRHGSRAPGSAYPNDPYDDVALYWPRGYLQQTEVGDLEQHSLGLHLRQRYCHLLPLTYNTNDTYVRSSDTDRTLMSAICTLDGLYPKIEKSLSPVPFQPIPVHTTNETEDKMLRPWISCAKYITLLSLVRDSPEYQCLRNHTAKLREEVNKYAGFDNFDVYIFVTLDIQNLYNFPLPHWTTKYYPNPLRDLWLFEVLIAMSATRDMQRLMVGQFLKEIIGNMKDKLSGTLDPDRSLYIYSAHIYNMYSILQALRVSDGMLVPFTATLFFELREKCGRHYVTVWYKRTTTADPNLLQLPGCECLCPLDRFIELTKDVVAITDHDECTDEVEEGQEFDFEIPANAIPPDWEHCFQKPHMHKDRYHAKSCIDRAKKKSY